MDEELVLVLGCFTAWLLLGALALQVSANGLFGKKITLKRALITQLAMIWVLPVWTNAYFIQFADRFIKPHPEIDFLIAFLCLILQILIVRFSFKIPLLSAVICLIIALLPSLAAFRLAMPDHVLMGGARSYVTKAHGQMRHSTESLQEWRTQHGELPKPVNREGKDVAGSPRSAGGEGDILIYFEGPSLLPPEPFRVEGRDGPPLDPFKRSDPATYSYAAGPIHGATGRFILSSWGPDEVDQSDEVEELFLIECEGNSSRFKENDRTYRLMYSPTNGTVSQGELFWPGEVE